MFARVHPIYQWITAKVTPNWANYEVMGLAHPLRTEGPHLVEFGPKMDPNTAWVPGNLSNPQSYPVIPQTLPKKALGTIDTI